MKCFKIFFFFIIFLMSNRLFAEIHKEKEIVDWTQFAFYKNKFEMAKNKVQTQVSQFFVSNDSQTELWISKYNERLNNNNYYNNNFNNMIEVKSDKNLKSSTNIIPKPNQFNQSENDEHFILSAQAKIIIDPDTPEMRNIALFLAEKLRPATGFELPILTKKSALDPLLKDNIYLSISNSDLNSNISLKSKPRANPNSNPNLNSNNQDMDQHQNQHQHLHQNKNQHQKQDQNQNQNEESYQLIATKEYISMIASRPVGLFRGLQTLRQMLPPSIENNTLYAGPWTVTAGTIEDAPRFAWRGAMLDVSRHFFTVAEVKRYIDLLATYKINRFHLHLSDDQGWRIAIHSWPNLSKYGGSTAVGGVGGGFYKQAEYTEIVSFAQSRYVMLIPEIDLPGHVNAALASYAELNCDGVAPALYTGTEVGFSSLCMNKSKTYAFVEDVIKEIAALTPGPYIHIGGDEALATNKDEYIGFIKRIQSIVQATGKQMIGWEEIAQINLTPTTVVQHWNKKEFAVSGAQQGAKVIMSPASLTYLDIKYDEHTQLGQDWVGYIDEKDGYDWDPTTLIEGINENNVIGLEAPLWTETIKDMADVEYMAFPRIIGYAEIGWSTKEGRHWDEYKERLRNQELRLKARGVNFYKSALVPWD